jgi:transposase
VAVAIEATAGWRWVWRELAAGGFEIRLAESASARGLLARRRSAKTDRLDARWLAAFGDLDSSSDGVGLPV